MPWWQAALAALVTTFTLLGLFTQSAAAHEVRPAYLEITPAPSSAQPSGSSRDQSAPGAVSGWHVLWKQPVVGDMAVALQPVLSGNWLENAPAELSRTPTHLVKRWHVVAPPVPLEGQTITIAGLERTITDTLVRIELADGTQITRLLKPDAPSMIVEAGRGTPAVAAYPMLGIEHILFGIDHLLFVLGLLLLVQARGRLLWTLTAFTLAHSITLGLSALDLVRVPVPLVEAAIALSILFVAVEVVNLWRGRPGMATRWPWAVAFAFGLLHGFGFASALGDVGLPKDAAITALLLFNLGVEIGQIVFVAVTLTLLAAVRRFGPAVLARGRWLAPYAIGGLARFWFIERSVAVFAG